MPNPLLTKLLLTNFRNFPSRKIEVSKILTLFVGSNGVGKTNILEGLTLLGRNSSLLGSSLEEMVIKNWEGSTSQSQFGIYSEISDHEFIEKMAVSFNLEQKKKSFYVNGEPLSKKRQGDLRQHFFNFVFLTPQIEQLFILGKTARRDYLDKIVSDLDWQHQTRLNNYQKLLKERLAILQKYSSRSSEIDKKSSNKWLDIVENNIVEIGVAIASARIEALDFFNKAIASFSSNFPKARLQVIGDVEQYVMKGSALQLEELYRQKLTESRHTDLESFKTSFGVHRSDFDAIFPEKNISAIYCSTGEQKAIMIGITLARARISASYKNQPTILILDEVVSHLDEKRREDLLCEVESTRIQSFASATSVDLIPKSYLDSGFVGVVNI